MKLKVYRACPCSSTPSTKSTAHYDTFDLAAAPGATVLSLLFEARDRLDDSLAFRYSCRGAVCGSCAMLINKVPRLACRTQVEALLAGRENVELKPYPAIEGGERWNPAEEVLVEPLPHLPVLKDLVVDMTRFFEFLRAVEPVLRLAGQAPEREYRMESAAVKELERYTNCILCGACYGACPVDGSNPDYFGPAALAQLYRFHIDPRESRGLAPLSAEENGACTQSRRGLAPLSVEENGACTQSRRGPAPLSAEENGACTQSRLALADKPEGWWACQFHANCHRVCPKGVPPNLAIGRARHELEKKRTTGRT